MALQGSLSDFALPDVLTLLASTKKSGELHVDGEGGAEGRIYVVEGKVVHTEAGLTTSPVDTLFELLRVDGGAFAFHNGAEAPLAGAPQAVEPLLREAAARLEEWRGIEAVVPSLASAVSLVPEAPTSPVVVEAEQWRVLVAVADGGTVEAVATAIGEGEFGACRAVKELVDAGLVAVDVPTFDAESLYDSLAGLDADDDEAPVLEVLDDESDDVDVDDDAGADAPEIDLDSLVEIPTARRRRSTKSVPSTDEVDAAPTPTKRLSQAAAKKAAQEAADLARPHALAREASDDGDGEGGAELPGVGHVTAEEAAALEDAGLVDENGEPINRHLLLKFLSSVRS